jgi:hypothetical protein
MRRGAEGPEADCNCCEKNKRMMLKKERNDSKGLPKTSPNFSSILSMFTPVPNSNAIA